MMGFEEFNPSYELSNCEHMMARTKKQISQGVCKLTLHAGKFVESHLIPKALTKAPIAGVPLVESGLGRPPSRKWSSWYDREIVTAEGEAILSKIDSSAITELRKHRLVWSGWGPLVSLPTDPIADTGWGLRKLKGIDGRGLRLFFLSLLWRAAVSKRPGFEDVQLSEQDLDRVRLIVVSGNTDPVNYFPITLTQISTLGDMQNLTPFHRTKNIRTPDGSVDKEMPFIRFYFDGLIAHIHPLEATLDEFGPTLLGAQDELVIPAVTYDRSFQKENIERLMLEAFRDWPLRLSKL
jgi:hypothetical protein